MAKKKKAIEFVMDSEFIKKKNLWFKELSDEQKRVEIAKDVISQINERKYIALRANGYVCVNEGLVNPLDLQGSLYNPALTCEVCAIGAVFMSKLRLGNSAPEMDEYDDLDDMDDDTMVDNMDEIFSKNQLRTMEVAFEGSGSVYTFKTSKENHEATRKALDFHAEVYDKLDHDDEDGEVILKAIMNNIIENNGTFLP